MLSIARHRTAIERSVLSKPAQLALRDGVIQPERTIFDYGCGRGGDVARLTALGLTCAGWDPVHRPDGPLREADVILLSYVVNVIENPEERAQVLQSAWRLARGVLVVAARLEVEERPTYAILHHDGFVTRAGTFQKLYQQHELRQWVDRTLATTSVSAGPGVLYVFRDEMERQRFIAARQYRQSAVLRISRPDELYERHKDLLTPCFDFLCQRGRAPHPDELPNASAILEVFGTLDRAVRVIRNVVDEQQWQRAATQRTQDILVYLALAQFRSRPKKSELPTEILRDIRAFFTSYQAAIELADAMLFSLKDMQLIERVCRQSNVGKNTPAALYLHRSVLHEVDPILRLYEGCAHAYIGEIGDANLIKLHRKTPQISYLTYPDFDRDPHPALQSSFLVDLQAFRVDIRQYDLTKNPPILHRKETFVTEHYPLWDKFSRLTAQEEKFGLYAEPARIGTRDGWQEVLREQGVTLRGHRVLKTGRRTPSKS